MCVCVCFCVFMCNEKVQFFHDPTFDYRRKQNDFCDSRYLSSLQLWKVELGFNFLIKIEAVA